MPNTFGLIKLRRQLLICTVGIILSGDLINGANIYSLESLRTFLGRSDRGINGIPKYPKHTVDIIKSHGYPVETHNIETEDGYILEIHRIPPLFENEKDDKLPVLLTHGNFQSSAEWVINRPVNNSFGFLLHSQGYDVWLGNNRGNPYGRKHRSLRTVSPSFWNFSFHEMGLFDMPATIDYVLEQTNKSKLHYVSLSMGPAGFLAGLSHKSEYNDKIASAVLMGPTVFMANFYNGLVYFMSFASRFIGPFLEIFGSIPAIPPVLGNFINNYLPTLCDPKIDVIGFCSSWIQMVYGQDGDLITKQQVAQVFATTPASGSSLKLGNHVLQLWGSKGFNEYDYGRLKNLQVYKQAKPPSYNLSKATVPIALFVGEYDIMGHREDAKTLASKLPNLIELYFSPYKQFCHLDFVYGREVAAQLYYHAIDIFKRYENVIQ